MSSILTHSGGSWLERGVHASSTPFKDSKKLDILIIVKLKYKVVLLCSGLIVLFSLGMSLYQVHSLLSKTFESNNSNGNSLHYALFLPEQQDFFSSELQKGALHAAKDLGISLSIHSLDSEGDFLALARYVGVNGVIVCPDSDNSLLVHKLEDLRKNDISVVLAVHSLKSDLPFPFVGVNSFDYGKKIANIILEEIKPSLSIAVLYSDKTKFVFAERELLEMGINSVLDPYRYEPVFSYKTDTNPRSAEMAIYELFRSRFPISTIVFTDSQDTLAGTQAIIDLGLHGKVTIIGSGDDSVIQNYIDKKIITESLVVNAKQIGYSAVRALYELDTVGYTSNSVDVGIRVLTQSRGAQ